MEFNIHLSMDYLDKQYGGSRLYADMLAQAVLADQLGYKSVSVTEHHILELGLNPAPLMTAVKIAAHTKHVEIGTGVVVLPLHDMRTYAGEVVMADILTDERLVLGVGRGAFAFEMGRMGIPMAETPERFNDALNLLQTLLTQEEVSWDSKYYKFDPLTIMPRPTRPGGPPMQMAVLKPDAIYHCTKRGFNILTNALTGDKNQFEAQVQAFRRAKDELGDAGKDLTLSVSRAGFIATSEAHRREKIEQAHLHYCRFDNVFVGPGIVENGMTKVLPRKQTKEELAESLLICSPSEMVDRLGVFADLGVDRVSLTINFGPTQAEALETIQCIAEEVMPHFAQRLEQRIPAHI